MGSAVALLNKLGIKPFSYGIKVNQVYENGSVYDAAILDLSENDLLMKFMGAVSRIAAIGIEIGYPSTASVPFQVRNAFKKICALAIESGYEFDELKELKEGASKAAAPAPASSEKKAEEEEEEESSEGMAFDMFGGGGDAEEKESE